MIRRPRSPREILPFSAASAVAGPTAATRGASRCDRRLEFSLEPRRDKNRTAFWLVNRTQSNSSECATAHGRAAPNLRAAAKADGMAAAMTSAPMSFERAGSIRRACSGARVTTMRFPASGFQAQSWSGQRIFPRGAEFCPRPLRSEFRPRRFPSAGGIACRSRASRGARIPCRRREKTRGFEMQFRRSSRRAHAPSGTWQPPCSSCSSARSAVTQARVSASSSAATKREVSASSARVSIPRAPWPTAGSITSAFRICVMRLRQRPGDSRPPRPARSRRIRRHRVSSAACPRCRADRQPRDRGDSGEAAPGGAGCWCRCARRAARSFKRARRRARSGNRADLRGA